MRPHAAARRRDSVVMSPFVVGRPFVPRLSVLFGVESSGDISTFLRPRVSPAMHRFQNRMWRFGWGALPTACSISRRTGNGVSRELWTASRAGYCCSRRILLPRLQLGTSARALLQGSSRLSLGQRQNTRSSLAGSALFADL